MGSNYERRYGLKRHGIETMLALMSQIANAHALGLLVIDEIQHLSRSRSGGSQEMLNFFVTMVNIIGVPVMLIGTPKAREILRLICGLHVEGRVWSYILGSYTTNATWKAQSRVDRFYG